MPDLTAPQHVALAEFVGFARAHGMTVTQDCDMSIHFHPETRAGRGHDIDVFAADSYYVVSAHIDPYGNSRFNFGEVTWWHAEDGDGADCPTCDEPEEG